MNDDEVNCIVEPPYNHRNAYMLFYMRDSDSLETAVAQATAPSPEGPSASLSSIGKRRARENDDVEEDIGEPVRQALLSSNGAGPSNPVMEKKVGGMLPKQDRPPQLSHLAKPSFSRPPHNQLPPFEDEREEVESLHLRKKAKPDVGDTSNREGERPEGKKKKKKKKRPQGNIVELSPMSLSDNRHSSDPSNVPSDHEEVLETSDLANKAFILSTPPPLPPSTSSAAATPSPSKKRKLVEYSSGGENGSMESDDADGDRRSKKSKASSPASSASTSPGQRDREDTLWSGPMPNSMFAQPSSSLSPQQQRQWNVFHKPKKQKYLSQHKREQRRKSAGNPFGFAGHPAGGSPGIGRNLHKRPRGI